MFDTHARQINKQSKSFADLGSMDCPCVIEEKASNTISI